MNTREKEAVEIIGDLEEAGFLTIPEIRHMLVLGTKHQKTNERIEDILSLIAKNKKYKILKERHRRQQIINRLKR